MDLGSPNNEVVVDLNLSLGLPGTSVQPETSNQSLSYINLLNNVSPPTMAPMAPPVAHANLQQFTHQPMMDRGGHAFNIAFWNAATASAAAQPPPQNAVPPTSSGLPPPVHAGSQPPAQSVAHVNGTTRGPGRPPASAAAGGSHQNPRRKSSQAASSSAAVEGGRAAEIVAPYPWATSRPATVHTLAYLLSKSMTVISGQLQCKRCEKVVTVEYSLGDKFMELYNFVVENKETLRDRAPNQWMNPRLPPCEACETGMKPVISEKKEEINWLFLLLGQLLGCCTLDQLRYFCDKTKKHRTGAKDRVLYITYLALCKQLLPSGPFDR